MSCLLKVLFFICPLFTCNFIVILLFLFALCAFFVSCVITAGESFLVYKDCFKHQMCRTNEKMSLSTSICMDLLFGIDLYLATNSPCGWKEVWWGLWKTAHSSLLADIKQQLISFCAGKAADPAWCWMATNNCVSSGFYSGESKVENDPPSLHLKPVMHINRLGYVYSSTMTETLAPVHAASRV